MLLIEPAFKIEEWIATKRNCARFSQFVNSYCEAYALCVLSLPGEQLEKVVGHLARGLESRIVEEESFHTIVCRELTEREFEPTNKVARLTVLAAVGNSLREEGVRLFEGTERLLEFCQQMIPAVLIMAVDDHFGILSCDAVAEPDRLRSDGLSEERFGGLR